MRLVSRLVWSLAGVGTIVSASGELEVGIVFPRANETYAPMKNFPIVFAVHNPRAAELLALDFDTTIRYYSPDGTDDIRSIGLQRNLADTNFTSDPYFVYHYVDLETEGRHWMWSDVYWQHCGVVPQGYPGSNTFEWAVNGTKIYGYDFFIKKGAREVDLVAATAVDRTCSTDSGFVITVSDETHDVPAARRIIPAGTCALLASPSPTPTAKPCQVKLDSATTASMSAAWHAQLCSHPEPWRPDDCPKEEENSVQRLAVAGVASFAAALGAAGFLVA